jgi:RimJ/RimL family protein N-acetyltransferase
MDGMWQALRELPAPRRGALVGAVVLGACGAVVGLVIGLQTYAPTAWAAALEVGIPAALVGAALGLLVGVVLGRAGAQPSLAVVTRVEPEVWRRLRDVRLMALAESPEMFGSNLAKEQSFDEAEWRRRAARPATLLATRDGVDVGMAGVYELEDGWCVMGMWLAPAARGTGVVEALVHACEAVARDAGATTLALGVMEDNPRGRRAYTRLGYRLTGTREHVRDGRDELLMTRTLPPAPGASPTPSPR